MRGEVRNALHDALQRGENILEFTAGIDFDEYERNLQLRLAVERSFEITGEALNRIRRCDSSVFCNIPDTRSVISFRNVIVHTYDILDNAQVWRNIQDDLPFLRRTLRMLLEER